MAKEKSFILAVKNGCPMGYIKSISYTNRTFKLTDEKYDAKGYVGIDKLMSDIDFLASIDTNGFGFMYN